jgi:hypothetical protein
MTQEIVRLRNFKKRQTLLSDLHHERLSGWDMNLLVSRLPKKGTLVGAPNTHPHAACRARSAGAFGARQLLRGRPVQELRRVARKVWLPCQHGRGPIAALEAIVAFCIFFVSFWDGEYGYQGDARFCRANPCHMSSFNEYSAKRRCERYPMVCHEGMCCTYGTDAHPA